MEKYRFVILYLIIGVISMIIFITALYPEKPNLAEKGDFTATWSPDGKQIALESWRSGNADIWIYDFETDTMTNLTPKNPSNDYRPVWMPDKTAIIYITEQGETSDIISINLETLETTNLTDTPETTEFAPSVSADGQYLAYASRYEGHQDIVIQNLQTGETVNITKDEAITNSGLPNWYKHDNQFVFTADSLSDGTHIWISSPQGNPKQLTTNGLDTSPIWSPTDPIITMISRRNNNLDVWLFDTQTDQYTNLTSQNEQLDADASWSPDGSKIAYMAYTQESPKKDLWVINLETNDKKNITNGITEVWTPVWSPVDDRIAFISYEGFTTLWVINADGTDATNLTGKFNN